MNVKNKLRTMLGIRVERQPLPPGPKPQVGSNIVMDKFRIRLKYPVSDEQWDWFTAKGWRTIDMRTNRRRYTCVPDKVLMKMLTAQALEREVLHQRLVKFAADQVERRKAAPKIGLRADTVIKVPRQESV
jgi:hypothetical protein